MKAKFYNFISTNSGSKLVNINQIAMIEQINNNTVVTMNITDDKGKFITFIANLPYGSTTGDIMVMDKAN